ncbi:GNAT family N-acetyltransferase [Streptomyces sp. NPDC020096]
MEFAGGGRLEVRITPSDVGKRVSVRRVAEIVGGRPVFSDVVGLLTSWAGGVLIVTRRNGETVHIPEQALAAAKVVPDRPARARRATPPDATAHELQELASRGWPALDTERLGDWMLRASGGFTRRANSVLPLGDPGLPLDAAIQRVRDWYGERGLVPYVQAATGTKDCDERLDAELARDGWTAEAFTLVYTGPIAPVADGPGAERVTLSRVPDAAWLGRYHRTGELAEAAVRVLTGGPSVWFATVPGGARGPAAIGRCVVDGRWAQFGAVEVDPRYRRAGLATAVMAALARRALDEGATGGYLQVEEENEGARALYAGMGFTTHHGYHYRRAPQGGTR